MELAEQKRLVLRRFLEERRHLILRPAKQFLEGLLCDAELLGRMRFCLADERRELRNSVLVSTADVACWAVLLDNDPERGGAQARGRLALEGLDLSPADVLARLRSEPVWFLALEPAAGAPKPGEAVRIQRTVLGLAGAASRDLRRLALLDQIDAALDEGNREAYSRLQQLLRQVS